jgi:hypothetical protein
LVSALPFTLSDQQRAPNQQRIVDEFRDEVIAHVRRKAVLVPELTDHDYEKIAIFLYQRVDAYLRNYETVTYDSYVRMLLVYFLRGTEQVEGPDMQATLRNEHFGINTRVQVAYDLSRLFLEKGF